MNRIQISYQDIEDIANSFISQTIEGEQKGEFYYFSDQQARDYIHAYVGANNHSNYVYALDGKEAFVIIRRENEYLKLLDIFKLIYKSYKILGFKLLRSLQRLERDGELSLEEKYAIRKKKFLFVGMVVVKKEYQGKGYFRKILEEVFEMAKEEKRLVVLNTDTIEKCEKYKHLGFELKQIRKLEENNVRYDLEWTLKNEENV